MKLRTSFFNPAVFCKDITRFAPAWGIYTIGGVFIMLQSAPISLIGATQFSVAVVMTMQGFSFLNLVYGLINALLLFGDLFKSRLCNGLHALPIRREAWFITHYIAGFSFSFIPNLIFSLLITLFCGFNWYLGPIWLITMSLQYLLFFSLAVFSVMCAGKRSAATVVYLILNFFSYIVLWFYTTLYAPLLPGLVTDYGIFSVLCPVVELISRPVVLYETNHAYSITTLTFLGFGEGWGYLWICGGIGLVFALLSLLLYRRRKLESAGDFIAERFISPVFLGIYTLCVAAMFQLFFASATLLLPVSLAIGFFTGLMLLQRKINVFSPRNLITFGIVAGLMLGSVFLAAVDPLGVTCWTPQPEQVTAITVSGEYNFDPNTTYQDRITVTDSKEIRDLINIHQELISQSSEWLKTDEDASEAVHLIYTLENGTQVRREYHYAPNDPVNNQLNYYFFAPEYVLGYDNWEDYLFAVSQVEVGQTSLYGSQALPLLWAMQADCEAARNQPYHSSDWKGSIAIYLDGDLHRYVSVPTDWHNTIKWLNTNAPGWDY